MPLFVRTVASSRRAVAPLGCLGPPLPLPPCADDSTAFGSLPPPPWRKGASVGGLFVAFGDGRSPGDRKSPQAGCRSSAFGESSRLVESSRPVVSLKSLDLAG